MALPESASTQALAPGDKTYLTAAHGHGQDRSRDSAAVRADEQFSAEPYDSRWEPAGGSAADTNALNEIESILLAGAGAHTGVSLASTLTAINDKVKVVREATDNSTFTFSGPASS
jgi:hypothetical protein